MQFKVPQYIEVENKLVANLSFRQLLYIVGGIALSYIVFRFSKLIPFGLLLAIPIIIGIAIFVYLLAFYPKEKLGRPFVEIVQSALKYAMKGKLYTWKRTVRKPVKKPKHEEESTIRANIPTSSVITGGHRLGDVSMNLTIGAEETDLQEKTTGRNDSGPITTQEAIPQSNQPAPQS